MPTISSLDSVSSPEPFIERYRSSSPKPGCFRRFRDIGNTTRHQNSLWESRFRTLEKRERGGRADKSKADFTFCMTAIDWAWSVAETAQRLMQESTKAQENGEKYAVITARNAAAAVERRIQLVKSTPHP